MALLPWQKLVERVSLYSMGLLNLFLYTKLLDDFYEIKSLYSLLHSWLRHITREKA